MAGLIANEAAQVYGAEMAEEVFATSDAEGERREVAGLCWFELGDGDLLDNAAR
jgi:hypothetical protein